jgi:hypothetical protein
MADPDISDYEFDADDLFRRYPVAALYLKISRHQLEI